MKKRAWLIAAVLLMAVAAVRITHSGGSNVACTPAVTSARVMIPIVFCASLLPWLKAM